MIRNSANEFREVENSKTEILNVTNIS